MTLGFCTVNGPQGWSAVATPNRPAQSVPRAYQLYQSTYFFVPGLNTTCGRKYMPGVESITVVMSPWKVHVTRSGEL